MNERITVVLTIETIKSLDKKAKDEHRSRSNMLEVILREYFEGKK
jgi:metal-responsive CopG/Arc/MetJ family transcriptional regulator